MKTLLAYQKDEIGIFNVFASSSVKATGEAATKRYISSDVIPFFEKYKGIKGKHPTC